MWRNNPWTSKRFLRFGIGTLKTYPGPRHRFSSGGMTGCLENDKFHKNWSFRWPFGGLTSRVNASPTSLVVRRRWVLDGGCFGDFCLMSSKMIFKEVVNLEFFHKVWAKMKKSWLVDKMKFPFLNRPPFFCESFSQILTPIVGMMETSRVWECAGNSSLEIEIQMFARSEDSWDNIPQSPTRHVWSFLSRIPLHWNVKPSPCDATKKIVHAAVSES